MFIVPSSKLEINSYLLAHRVQLMVETLFIITILFWFKSGNYAIRLINSLLDIFNIYTIKSNLDLIFVFIYKHERPA